MEEIKRKVEELTALIREQRGALICFVKGQAEDIFLTSEGQMNMLALLIGTATLSDEDCRAYIRKGVEAAEIALEKKELKKNTYAEA